MKGLNAYLAIGLVLLAAFVMGKVVLLLAQFANWLTHIAGIVSIPFLLYGVYAQIKEGHQALPESERDRLDE